MHLGNHFENLAAQQLVQASKRRHKDAERRAAKSVVLSDADAPMVGNAMEKARDERNRQITNYNRHKADERDALCHGPYGRDVTALMSTLKGLAIDNAQRLVDNVLAAGWLMKADLDTKHTILSMIADAILKLRIRNGLSPFDDAIGDEPPTAFQIIRKGVMGV